MKLTPEIFETLCGSIPTKQVTKEMLDLATAIPKSEAKRLLASPASEWWLEPIVGEIEAEIPRCKDRHVQAVLLAAQEYGQDNWDGDVRVAAY